MMCLMLETWLRINWTLSCNLSTFLINVKLFTTRHLVVNKYLNFISVAKRLQLVLVSLLKQT